jgi:hypothetical protein
MYDLENLFSTWIGLFETNVKIIFWEKIGSQISEMVQKIEKALIKILQKRKVQKHFIERCLLAFLKNYLYRP